MHRDLKDLLCTFAMELCAQFVAYDKTKYLFYNYLLAHWEIQPVSAPAQISFSGSARLFQLPLHGIYIHLCQTPFVILRWYF